MFCLPIYLYYEGVSGCHSKVVQWKHSKQHSKQSKSLWKTFLKSVERKEGKNDFKCKTGIIFYWWLQGGADKITPGTDKKNKQNGEKSKGGIKVSDLRS